MKNTYLPWLIGAIVVVLLLLGLLIFFQSIHSSFIIVLFLELLALALLVLMVRAYRMSRQRGQGWRMQQDLLLLFTTRFPISQRSRSLGSLLNTATIAIVTASVVWLVLLWTGTALSNHTTAPSAQAITLNVFADSSLGTPFNTISGNFLRAHPGVTVKFNFADSQKLATQIAGGASVDVFAANDTTAMQKAIKDAQGDGTQIFAQDQLVVIVAQKDNAAITLLKDLAQPGIKLDIGASTAWQQTLDKLGKSTDKDYGAGYETNVKKNTTQNDNAKTVIQNVKQGKVDVGVVYETDLATITNPKLQEVSIPGQYNSIMQYPIAAIGSSLHMTLAQQFVLYIFSSEGQAALTKAGFTSFS